MQVSEIHNQQHLWPPLIVVRLLETDANNDPFQILLSFVNNISWNFPINSDFYFIYILRNQLEVLEIYNIRNVTFIEKVHNGVNNRGALNYYSLLQKDKRRSNFRKLVMVAVTMVSNFFIIYNFLKNCNLKYLRIFDKMCRMCMDMN